MSKFKESIGFNIHTADVRNNRRARSKFASIISQESIREFETIKEAAFHKLAMPVAQGQLKLKNSSSNLKWWVIKPEGRVEQIANEIQKAFTPFFTQLSKSGKEQQLDPKAYFPNGFQTSEDRKKNAAEPQCSLRVEFGFARQLIPTDKEFQGRSESILQEIEIILPGFRDFINAIQDSRLTLQPFFHKISPSKAAGTLISKAQIEQFIEAENQRYRSGSGSMLPDGTLLNTSSFYSNQMQLMQNGVSLFPTMTDSFDRIYDTEQHLNGIHDVMPLIRAVLEKIRQGYSLDENGVKTDVQSYKQKSTKTRLHSSFREEKTNKIIQSFRDALTALGPDEDPSSYETLWHDKSSNTIYRGFRVIGNKSAKVPVGLDIDDIRIMLKNLTQHGPGVVDTFLYPDQFVVPGASMKYQSNGWDTHPTKPESTMPLLPSLRNINNQLEYDFDQINLGRIHLAMYGKQVKDLLSAFGEKCKNWFNTIKKQQATRSEASEIINHIIGFVNAHQRTNAETLAENLQQLQTHEAMMQRLQTSSSSKVRSTKSIESGKNSYIDPECFRMVQTHGYYVSKMMDLASAIMHRSCEESIYSRISTKSGQNRIVPERFYGRRYSTSGGKAAYGSVVVGIRYAFNSVELGSHDSGLRKIVRQKRKKNDWERPESGEPEIVRQTEHYQQGDVIPAALQPDGWNAIIKLVENIQFWIGISSSDSDFKKTTAVADDWPSLLSQLHTLYPGIDAEDGMALFDPLNANIKNLQNAVSKTINDTLKHIKTQGSQEDIEVVMVNYDGSTRLVGELHAEDADVSDNFEERSDRSDYPVAQPYPGGNVTSVGYATMDKLRQNNPTLNAPVPLSQKTPAQKPTPPNQPPIVPNNNADKKQDKPKPFPMPVPSYITKKKPSRSLFRKGFDPNSTKLQRADIFVDILIKTANKLDKIGKNNLADKIDQLLKLIQG